MSSGTFCTRNEHKAAALSLATAGETVLEFKQDVHTDLRLQLIIGGRIGIWHHARSLFLAMEPNLAPMVLLLMPYTRGIQCVQKM
eukprot:1140280-Pelagomonas_calceolata.AAC.2